MKSSSGAYYGGLDHIRATALFMVFTWHFIHVGSGQLAPPPAFPLSLLTEGHTGVALFITLSGYLFAKLLDGKSINYLSFIWNRFLRLAPLLTLVIFAVGFREYLSGKDLYHYVGSIFAGIVKPSLPNGGWSITTEFHFYLLLPVLLCLSRKSKYSLMVLLATAVLIRSLVYLGRGEIHTLSYWTIVGRIDQFLLGMLAYQFRSLITGRHMFVICSLVLFATFYWYFDSQGGFYKNPSYPSPSAIWIFMPTIEGFAYALMIAWYDNSFLHSNGKLSRFVSLIGIYSYSIYLLHFFLVFRVSRAISENLVDLSNIYLALIVSPICFLLMIPIGYVSYRFVESPFLKLRTRYILAEKANASPLDASHGI